MEPLRNYYMLLCLKSPDLFARTESSFPPLRSGAGRAEEETAELEKGGRKGVWMNAHTRLLIRCCSLCLHMLS